MNRRCESFRTTAARAGFYFSEDAQQNASASSMAGPEFLSALPALDFLRISFARLQLPRALSRPRAFWKSQPARPHPPIALISTPPARSARARAQGSQRSKPCRIVEQAMTAFPTNSLRRLIHSSSPKFHRPKRSDDENIADKMSGSHAAVAGRR